MKSTTKDQRITVRLTPNQAFIIDELSKSQKIDKAKIVRYMLDYCINNLDINDLNNNYDE